MTSFQFKITHFEVGLVACFIDGSNHIEIIDQLIQAILFYRAMTLFHLSCQSN